MVRADEDGAFSVLRSKIFKFLISKISKTIHAISINFEVSETSTNLPERFFELFDFGLWKVENESDEVHVFSVRAHQIFMLNNHFQLISMCFPI